MSKAMGYRLRHVRVSWLILGFCVFCLAVLSASSLFLPRAEADETKALSAALSTKWLVSRKYERRGPGGDYAAQIFERFVFAGDTSFSIGNIVFFKFPKQANSEKTPAFDPDEVVEKIGFAMGLTSWKTRKVKSAYVFEAKWEAGRRHIRLFLTDGGDHIAVSAAMLRLAYFDSTALESELIQRSLAKVLDRPIPWLEKMVSLLIPDAYASCDQSCSPTDYLCLVKQTNCIQSELAKLIDKFGSSIPSLTEAIGGMNGNWANTNGQIPGLKASLDNAIGQIPGLKASWDNTNRNWADTNGQIAGIKASWDRSNDILERSMRPENAFLFAAASAAGAVTGALAVNLAVDAIAAGGKAIWEAITNEKEEAHILARFKFAREVWEKVSGAAADLEKTIDNLLELKEISQKFGIGREELLTRLGTTIEITKARKRQSEKLLDEAVQRGDDACVQQYGAETAQFSALLQEVSRLQDRLAANEDNELCQKLKTNLGKLRLAEGELQKARIAILAGQDVWVNRWLRENGDAFNEVERARKKVSRTRDIAKEAAEEAKKRSDLEIKAIWDRQIARCEKAKAGIGIIAVIPIIGEVRKWYSKRCAAEYLATEDGKALQKRSADAERAYRLQLDEADREYRMAMGMREDLYVSTPALTDELRGYNAWFDRVRSDQACLNNGGDCDVEGQVISRFDLLATKATKIDQVCASTAP